MRTIFYSLYTLIFFFATTHAQAQCNATAPSVLNITIDSATVAWMAVSGAVGYEYAVLPATSPQPASGTPITGTTICVGGLAPNTPQKAWVRTDCGSGSYSNWNSASFTTSCGAIGAVNVSKVTDSSAEISWGIIGGASGYEYVVNQTASDPSGAGTPVSNNNPVTVNGLTDSTLYYAHVRTVCGGTVYSAWRTQSFFTWFPTTVKSILYNNDIVAYPNPVHDVVSITLPEGKGILLVTDMMGKNILQLVTTSKSVNIDLSNQPVGLYLARFSGSNYTGSIKLLKQ